VNQSNASQKNSYQVPVVGKMHLAFVSVRASDYLEHKLFGSTTAEAHSKVWKGVPNFSVNK